MSEYKPNSYKSKAEEASSEKKVEKVISGTAKVKKKNDIHKFTEAFIAEDASNVKSTLVMDVLIPAVKKLVSDIITTGTDMILYGGTGRSESKKRDGSYISYNRFSDKRDVGRNYDSTRSRSVYSPNDITLETRGDAEHVLSQMSDLIETYGMVTVADLYDLVGITGNYTDQKYGWTNIRNAEPIRVRDGYMLKLPKALPID